MAYSTEVLADSPLIYYRMNETSGTAIDNLGSAGASADATANSTVDTETGLIVTDPTDGAMLFDWNLSTFKATTTYNIATLEPLTIEFWMKPTSLNGWSDNPFVVTCGSATDGVGCQYLDNDGTWRFTVYTIADYDFTSGVDASVGVSQHIVFVLDTGHDVSLYQDGQFVQTVTGTIAPDASTGTVVLCSRTGDTAGAVGVLDEVAIYTSALSAERILAHYNAGTATGQTLYPDADVDAGTWATTPLWNKLDEAAPGGDVISDTAS